MALAGPLFFGGCDASKAELQTTKTKLGAVTTERDDLKAQLAVALANLDSIKKERDGVAAKLAAAEAAAAEAAKPPEVVVPPPVVPVKPTGPAPAASKKPSGAKSGTLGTALLEKGPAVQQCAIQHALEKGAKKATVSVRVTINNTGAVVDSKVTANVIDGDGSKVQSCVEALMRSTRFPAVPTPLATDERSWTVAVE